MSQISIDRAVSLVRRVVERSESLSLDNGRDRERLIRSITEAFISAETINTPTEPISIPEVLASAELDTKPNRRKP